VAFRVQIDPDSDEQRVIVDLTIDGEIDEAVASGHAFSRAWLYHHRSRTQFVFFPVLFDQ
jgi:hypothetical protein